MKKLTTEVSSCCQCVNTIHFGWQVWCHTIWIYATNSSINIFDINITSFNVVFFLRLTTLLTWLKSTLLLKNKCFDTNIYMKTQCLQTNETQHYWKGKCLRSKRWSRERVALIKSLIYARWKETRLKGDCQIDDKNVSWYSYRVCHVFRLTKQDYYFWVDFDHFKIEQYFWRQLGQ